MTKIVLRAGKSLTFVVRYLVIAKEGVTLPATCDVVMTGRLVCWEQVFDDRFVDAVDETFLFWSDKKCKFVDNNNVQLSKL